MTAQSPGSTNIAEHSLRIATMPRSSLRLTQMPDIRRWLAAAPTALVHAIVLIVYVFFATQGSFRFSPDDPEKISYPMLADAFLAGQTNLPVNPNPQLLAMENPYDT